MTEEALQALKSYSWPGNIRELSNLIAYVATMSDSDEVDVADLPPKFRNLKPSAPNEHASQTDDASIEASFYDRVARFEKEILSVEYQRHEGNVSRMSLALGMDRSHLYTKLKEHGIHATRK
jgi:DNA-binding NtrC family response regulator